MNACGQVDVGVGRTRLIVGDGYVDPDSPEVIDEVFELLEPDFAVMGDFDACEILDSVDGAGRAAEAYAALIFCVPWPSISTFVSRGIETRVMVPEDRSARTSMMVSERPTSELSRASEPSNSE